MLSLFVGILLVLVLVLVADVLVLVLVLVSVVLVLVLVLEPTVLETSLVYMCQKLRKLAGSKVIAKISRLTFLARPIYVQRLCSAGIQLQC